MIRQILSCPLRHLIVAALLLLVEPALGAEHDPGSLAVRCGALIDGISDRPLRDAMLIIDRGRIRSLASVGAPPPSMPLLDLSAFTCLPGLIDMHVHIMENPADLSDLRVFYRRSVDEALRLGTENARATLAAGFTTVRNVGNYIAWSDLALRDRIERGEIIGPRIEAAGIYLTVPGGGGDLLIPGVDEATIPPQVRVGVARGAEQFAVRARLVVERGGDLVKLIASGAVLSHGGVPGEPEMTPQEIGAAVEVAHAAGRRVTAHAHGARSIREAILAGVDSIEHASLADTEAIALAAERQVPFVMDVYNGDYIATEGRRLGWDAEFLRKGDETTEAQRQVFTRALAAGVPLVYGTDAGVYPHGLNARQFRIMVERGMSEMQAIRSATSVAARLLGWEDRVGSLQPGRFADLVAVQGDPLSDIRLLERVSVVIKGGTVVRDDRGDAGASQNP